MKEWFLSREPRERLLLVAGGAVALLIIFWRVAWLPVSRGAAELRDSVAHKSALLVDVERAAAVAPAAASGARQGATDSMVVLVDKTSRAHGLAGAFTRTRPDGADGISVSFQDVPFDALLDWLVALKASYGVAVESATFASSRGPGLVSGQVLLRRS